MKIKKPIRIFWSPLSCRFYASAQYRDEGDGFVTVTGDKYDVTDQIAELIKEHKIDFSDTGYKDWPNCKIGDADENTP